MKVYTIWNQKGGVSKTTLAVNMAKFLETEHNMKTLLIDTDIQCNSTINYQGEYEGKATLYDVIVASKPIDINDAIQHTSIGDIIAGDPLLAEAESKYSSDIDGVYKLQEALENLKGYDAVVIDTNPSDNKILLACLIASDSIIVPVTAEKFSIQGLTKVNKLIQSVQKRHNPKLKFEGILISRVGRLSNIVKIGIETIQEYGSQNGINVFKTLIKDCVKVGESQALNETLATYAPFCTTALNYKSFLKELLAGEDE